MNSEIIEIFADAIKEYYSKYEFDDLCSQFEIEIPYDDIDPDYRKLAKTLAESINRGNTRRFLKALIPDLLKRCNERIENTSEEDKIYHQQMIPHFERFQLLLRDQGVQAEVKLPEPHLFTIKSEVKTFFSKTNTDVIIADPFVGVGTLECLQGIKFQISLLTGIGQNTFEEGFNASLKVFRSKGHNIKIRRHASLHDRCVALNQRCWLAGASLKDAGNVTLSLIEIIDNKSAVLSSIAHKWSEAENYP